MRTRSVWALFAGLVVVVLAGLAAAAVWWQDTRPLLQSGGAVRLTVEAGTGVRGIARQLGTRRMIVHPILFSIVARLHGQTGRLQAGVYEITPGMTARELLDRMVHGASVRDHIRFIEGWNLRQIRAALSAHPGLRHDSTDWTESQLLERLGAVGNHAEGLLFPDSYQFAAGSSDLVVLRQAHARARSVLERAWSERAPDLPVASPYEALVLASIVEKETGSAADRPRVAAVFLNRLRLGMRLQSDPTVIYGMGDAFDGNLRRSDLERDTPYNTYIRLGLPPTPVSSPGAASIVAVVKPIASKALFFVARGDGTSEFSETLAEHNRAVDRFQRR
ncbi:MAG: endolytic transglycosylase MltG [Betaproteobacteria bacterium]